MKKMLYYILRNSTEPKALGPKDGEQIKGLKINHDRVLLDKYQSMDRRSFEKELPPLDQFELDKSAKITNVINNRFIQIKNGLLVNKKVEEIFDNISISNFKKIDASIYKQYEVLKYKFFYILESPAIIDFSKSKFVLTDILGLHTQGDIQFNSADEFYDKCREIGANRVSFNHVFLKENFDMFRLPWESYLCISENLKNKLEKEKVTGIEILDTDIKFSLI